MIIIDVWKFYFVDRVQVCIHDDRHPLDGKSFDIEGMKDINAEQIHAFLLELRNYFGFKLNYNPTNGSNFTVKL